MSLAVTEEAPKKARRPKLSRLRKPSEMSLEEWQIALRREFGRAQDFGMENVGGNKFYSVFAVTNPASGRTSSVTIRGFEPGCNHCTCPDFEVNTLGTCKHVEFVLARLAERRGFKAAVKRGYAPEHSEVWLRAGAQRDLVFRAGTQASPAVLELAARFFGSDGVLWPEAAARLPEFLSGAAALGHEVRCDERALESLAERRDAQRRRERLQGASLQGLVRTELYPYQAEGVLFAARAGRALLGDEMGLGKTVQAVAWAELLGRDLGVERVLIVCPSSLKYQWKAEIEKFTGREATVVGGGLAARKEQYARGTFYTIVNYDVLHRDLESVARLAPDAVILDEAQRIKNWRTRAARAVKSLSSEYALVLTGTPLENRLEELHSLVEFVDRHRLGPMFRFLHAHQELDGESGRVVGYHNLGAIGETLAPILLRRRKAEVLSQLPERTVKTFFVPMTPAQRVHHEENREIVAALAARWRRNGFLTEVEQRRMTCALQKMRMSCDDVALLEPGVRSGAKLGEAATLLGEILEEPSAKVVVFSQWLRMHELLAEELEERGIRYEFLNGSVPTPERAEMVRRFSTDPEVRVFLSTDAGGTGLNLQVASTVLNLDLPWNPAVLEQRIARAHRIGQRRNVQVVNFVAEATVEQGMLSVLDFKQGLFDGVLDGGPDTIFLQGSALQRFVEVVEDVTASIPAAAPPEVVEPEPAPAPAPSEEPGLAPVLTAGAALLRELGGWLEAQRQPGRSLADSVIERDAQTGRRYLKLALPEEEAMQSVFAAAAPLLELFTAGLAGRSTR